MINNSEYNGSGTIDDFYVIKKVKILFYLKLLVKNWHMIDTVYEEQSAECKPLFFSISRMH